MERRIQVAPHQSRFFDGIAAEPARTFGDRDSSQSFVEGAVGVGDQDPTSIDLSPSSSSRCPTAQNSFLPMPRRRFLANVDRIRFAAVRVLAVAVGPSVGKADHFVRSTIDGDKIRDLRAGHRPGMAFSLMVIAHAFQEFVRKQTAERGSPRVDQNACNRLQIVRAGLSNVDRVLLAHRGQSLRLRPKMP